MPKIEIIHIEYFDPSKGDITPEQERENIQTVASVLNVLAVDVLPASHPLRCALEDMASEFKAAAE